MAAPRSRTPAKAAKPATAKAAPRQRNVAPPPPPSKARETVLTLEYLLGRGKWAVTAVITLAGLAAAWTALNWPVPATQWYVQDVFHRVATRIDSVDVLGLENRLETLNANKQAIIREKSDLDIKLKTMKDPSSRDLITNRQFAIQRDSESIAKQIDETNKRIQELKEHPAAAK